ncbi:hypothetical protein L4D15_23860 [Enterovibrio norvegicus]|uniref:hypothetical protein n=1 Tax=Enterovibrio norvegicus TaxID=188144 RepID=UPI003D108AC9
MKLDRYDAFFESSDDLSEQDKQELAPYVIDRFDGSTDLFFKEMKENLPEAFNSLKENYSAPRIGRWRISASPRPMYDLILESERDFIVGSMHNENFHDLYNLDDIYKMIPSGLRHYYYAVQGLQFVTDKNPSINWLNLPPSVSQARDILDYAKALNYDTRSARKMVKATPYKYLSTWIVFDSGSCLFTSSIEGDRIYFVDNGDFNNFELLEDPVQDISKYLAHVFSGKKPQDYVFNQHS